MLYPMRPTFPLLALAACALAWPAHAEKPIERSLVVAGQSLAILAEPPAADPATFVADPGSELARTTREQLVSVALREHEQQQLGVAALPAAELHLVRVHRDRAGKLFLYRPCDLGAHAQTVVTATELWLLGGEPFRVPIERRKRQGRVTTFELDTKGLPPFLATRVRVRAQRGGLYQIATGSEPFSDLAMTPAAAAKLPIVIRRCHDAKAPEFDFRASRAPR